MRRLEGREFLQTVFVLCPVFVLVTFCTAVLGMAAEWKWPKSISISTADTTSGVYVALSSAMIEMDRMTGMKVRVIPESAMAQKLRWLKDGETDFHGDDHGSIAVLSMMAEDEYAKIGPIQATSVWNIFNAFSAFIVRRDSDIKTIYDIKKHHKIAAYVGVRASYLVCEALLKWVGVDAVIVPCATWPSTQKAVIEGRADINLIVTTSGPAYEAEAFPAGIRCLELPAETDPEGAKRFLKVARVRSIARVEDGIKPCLGKISVAMPFSIHARKELDPELVYHFVKWLAENHNTYKDKHLTCKYMNIDYATSFLRTSALPIHEGTIRYLKEKGIWTANDDARQKYNTELLARYITAHKAAMAEADGKKIDISSKNPKWVELWESYRKDIPPTVMHLEKK